MKTNDCLSPKGLGCVRWRGRVWLGLALAGLALAARAPADDTNAAPVKDFGAGFAKFLALGLPDVKEARYVRLESSYGQAYEVRTERLKLEGNAWLLAEQPDKTARVLLGRTKVRELVDPQKLQKELAEKMKQARAQGGRAMMTLGDRRLGGTWKAADPKKDCDAILSYLQQSSTNEEDRGGYELKALTPSLFLSATHYYRTGLTNEANRIAQALFDRAGDARKVILGAMNQLADSQYEELFGDFSARPDWRAFAQGLQALLQRYPSGWRMAPAVRRLAERVKARAEQAFLGPIEWHTLPMLP